MARANQKQLSNGSNAKKDTLCYIQKVFRALFSNNSRKISL